MTIQFIIEGNTYFSMADACAALNLSRVVVSNRIKSTNPKWANWKREVVDISFIESQAIEQSQKLRKSDRIAGKWIRAEGHCFGSMKAACLTLNISRDALIERLTSSHWRTYFLEDCRACFRTFEESEV